MIAYIDPGSGMILLQAIIAAVLGVVIFFRDKMMMIFRAIFGRKSKSVSEEADVDTDPSTNE
ncbi:MAG: hypothetical protein ACYTDT_11665 [Planctomycetota bacterium]|jgi:hypothetical protein